MQTYAAEYRFEEAQSVKEKLESLEKFQRKSVVVNPSIHNVDVFSLVIEEDSAYVNFLRVMNGAIIQGHTVELKRSWKKRRRSCWSLPWASCARASSATRRRSSYPSRRKSNGPGISFTIPKIGDKKHLLSLSESNVRNYIREKRLQEEKQHPENRTLRLMEQMKKICGSPSCRSTSSVSTIPISRAPIPWRRCRSSGTASRRRRTTGISTSRPSRVPTISRRWRR